jgi:hypothetical protein
VFNSLTALDHFVERSWSRDTCVYIPNSVVLPTPVDASRPTNRFDILAVSSFAVEKDLGIAPKPGSKRIGDSRPIRNGPLRAGLSKRGVTTGLFQMGPAERSYVNLVALMTEIATASTLLRPNRIILQAQ